MAHHIGRAGPLPVIQRENPYGIRVPRAPGDPNLREGPGGRPGGDPEKLDPDQAQEGGGDPAPHKN